MNSKNKIVYFRLDAGNVIGFGHYYRCASIAHELGKQGIESVFIMRKRPSLSNFVSEYKILWLSEIKDAVDDNVETWINSSIENELQDLEYLAKEGMVIFVDHYGLTKKYHEKLKLKNMHVFGFKDYEKFDCAFSVEIDYRPINGCDTSVKKRGLKYLPLNPIISNYENPLSTEVDKNRKVGIYLGGLKPEFILKAYDIINNSIFIKKYNVEWIVTDIETRNKLTEQRHDNFKFTEFKEDIFKFYCECDFFIGAFGVSFFERGFLNIPQMNFVIADNQEDFASNIFKLGGGFSLGKLKTDTSSELLKNLDNAFKNLNLIREMAKKLKNEIDELGAKRISAAILEKIR